MLYACNITRMQQGSSCGETACGRESSWQRTLMDTVAKVMQLFEVLMLQYSTRSSVTYCAMPKCCSRRHRLLLLAGSYPRVLLFDLAVDNYVAVGLADGLHHVVQR